MKLMSCLFFSVLLAVLFSANAYSDVEYPKAVGDLVYRDSNEKIYGRDGDLCITAATHPGHVGIYVGDDKIVEALDLFGEVMENPLTFVEGERSFYSDKDGGKAHNPLGAKAHRDLVNNPNATTLRDNIVWLAKRQVGEGYDSNFYTQKGPDADDWTCVGLTEKVYESCAGKELIYHDDYGDENLYEGGLNITPDGYDWKILNTFCYYQEAVEFSQVNPNISLGRSFWGNEFIFFPWTQFNQETLIDSFDDTNIDATLIIDSSGSMRTSDRQNLRKAAAKIFVHNADDDDQIAIIDFDSYTRVNWSLQPLTANRDGILSAIGRIDSSGGTNLGAGLLAGYNQLKASTKPYKKAAIFMTDGQGAYNNQAELYLNDKNDPDDDWPVYTIGLGSGVNQTILQNIADTTGGIYFALNDPNQLQNVYFEIANLIREDGQPLLNTITIMFIGGTYCTLVDVPTHQESVTFLITWPGSEVSAGLMSPSGREITSDTIESDVYHAKGLTYELYRITNPEAGNWSINLYGVDLAPAGEEVRISASSVGPTAPTDSTPPVISISNPINGKTYFDQLPTCFHFIVEDPESAIVSQSALLNGIPINDNDCIILAQLGENVLNVTATNEANLTSEETVTFYVNYFSWLPPIKYQKGSSTETATYNARVNSTLPIKFAVFDEYNDFVVNPAAVKVVVEGTKAEFVYGASDTDIRINQEYGEDPNYIVNLHTNFNKWDYQMEEDGEYWIDVYFDNVLAAKTRIKLR